MTNSCDNIMTAYQLKDEKSQESYSAYSMVRRFDFKKIIVAIWLEKKKIWVAAQAWPQEMSPDKTLRSGRRRSKSEKPKACRKSAEAAFVFNMSLDFRPQESLEI